MDRAARYGHSLASLARAGSPPEPSATLPIQLSKARDTYDASGREKWREYIDAKDHEAALAEVQAGKLQHPGEYYDYQRSQGGDMVKTGDHWKAFQKADAYVSQSIDDGTELDANEYMKIHQLAAGGFSAAKKGWREGEVTWGLRDPTAEKAENLTSKGLQVEAGEDRTTVRVPAPARSMPEEVQALFDRYHESRKTLPHAAALDLYEQLEVLHPTKDASSRTNHLILNRLLAENGLAPAILNEPNTPEQSYEGVTENIVDSSQRGFKVAMQQDDRSVADLHASRRGIAEEEEMNRRVEALMSGQQHLSSSSSSSSSQQRPAASDSKQSTAKDEKLKKIGGILFGKKK